MQNLKRFIPFVLFFLSSSLAWAEKITVIQKDKSFSKTEMEIKVGDTIEFKNDDTVTHNVFSSSDGLKFDLKTQPPTKSSDVTFDKPGSGEIRCAIHPGMKIKLTVK